MLLTFLRSTNKFAKMEEIESPESLVEDYKLSRINPRRLRSDGLDTLSAVEGYLACPPNRDAIGCARAFSYTRTSTHLKLIKDRYRGLELGRCAANG
jgi:hypothetical protein